MATKIDNHYDQFDDEPIDESLPDEVQEMVELLRADRLQKIVDLGKAVAEKRDEAVAGRKASGIEDIWREDEEYYQGIDDMNRATVKMLKSPSPTSGGLSAPSKPADSGNRCTAFFNITAQFVDSAASRMADILLPSGDWNFTITAPEVDEDDSQVPGSNPVEPQDSAPAGIPPVAPPSPQTSPPAGAVSTPVPSAPDQPALSQKEQVEASVEKAEKRILDWLEGCSYHGEVRKVLEDSARIGTGILKGPVPESRELLMIKDDSDKKVVVFEKELKPGSKRVHPDRFYPDPACGDNIHDGNYCLELDFLTAKKLRELKDIPGYISESIDKALKDGPGGKYQDRISDNPLSEDDLFEVWYYYGNVDINTLSALKVDGVAKDSVEPVPAIVTLVNDLPIRASLRPLDTGGFPYDLMPWQPIYNSPWGSGIARKGRVAQDMLNASARAMMDNMGLSSGPMLIIRQSAVVPADGHWQITARKVWIATEQADTRSVADAFTAINIPTMQKELEAIIQVAYKMMEDSTSMAYLMQGQQGSAPDTVGGMELLNRNASSILRRLGRTFDEKVTEPHIRRYYAWLLMYGEDDEKVDLNITAVGSSSLVEREIQAIETQQLLQASANPIFGLDPKKTMSELLKIKRMNPDKFQYSEADLEAQKSAQPAPAPAVQAAQIRAESAEKIAQLEAQVEHFKSQIKAATDKHSIDTKVSLDAEMQNAIKMRDQSNAQQNMAELQLKERLAMLDYATKRNISLDQLKVELAKLATQKQLSTDSLQLEAQQHDTELQVESQQAHNNLILDAAKHEKTLKHEMDKHTSGLANEALMNETKLKSGNVDTPAIEVAGRAEPGQAFER